jgi:hypothetical protein
MDIHRRHSGIILLTICPWQGLQMKAPLRCCLSSPVLGIIRWDFLGNQWELAPTATLTLSFDSYTPHPHLPAGVEWVRLSWLLSLSCLTMPLRRVQVCRSAKQEWLRGMEFICECPSLWTNSVLQSKKNGHTRGCHSTRLVLREWRRFRNAIWSLFERVSSLRRNSGTDMETNCRSARLELWTLKTPNVTTSKQLS